MTFWQKFTDGQLQTNTLYLDVSEVKLCGQLLDIRLKNSLFWLSNISSF